MTDHQPALELTSKSYTRGAIQGRPVLVIYDAATDRTTVVSSGSKWYEKTMAALRVIEMVSATLEAASDAAKKKTVLHARKPRLIMPGSNASN